MDRRQTLSVVMTSYNYERFLVKAVSSIFAQSRLPDELIVVDDGSTDGSVALLDRLLANSPIAKTDLVTQANAGAHCALNTGIERTTGDLVTLLNSDDYYFPARFETMLAEVEPGKDVFLFSLLDTVDEHGTPLPTSNPWPVWYEKVCADIATAPTLGFALLLHSLPVTSGNFLFSRTLFDRTGGFAEFRFCHDWDFVMNCTRFVEPRLVRRPLMAYRVHGANTTESLRGIQEHEVGDALRSYVRRVTVETPLNQLAPCPQYWPNYFKEFTNSRKFHFGTKCISDYLRN